MEYLRSYNDNINDSLSPLDNPSIAGFLKLFLVLYGGLVAPKLPNSVLQWFNFVPFKLLVLFLILYTANKDPALSILIATSFYASMNVLNGKKAFESFDDVQVYDM